MKTITLESKQVGSNSPVFIIAEIGGNFMDLSSAKKLIDLAIGAGCDAVKIQNYTANTITAKSAIFDMENTGRVPQHVLFEKYAIGKDLTRDVFKYAKEKGVICFSTPSHESDVELLESIGATIYKIGSDDAINLPFIRNVARLGKPVLLSTGMCTLSEVQLAVDAILSEGNDQIILFHCTSNYPTHPDAVNLRALQTMQERFGVPVGYSDHTIGIDTCYAAAVLGAPILEFHFTHDKNADGPDHMLSKDPIETKQLVQKVRLLEKMMGDGIKRPAASEMKSRINNRKGVVLTRNVKAGERLTSDCIAIKRPGNGISALDYYQVLGKTAARDLIGEEVLTWQDIQG